MGKGIAPLLLLSLVALANCALEDDYYVASGVGGGAASTAGLGDSTSGRGGMGFGMAGSGSGGSGGAGSCLACNQKCAIEKFDGTEYAFCFEDATYQQAATACSRQGMTLAIVDDAEEDAWLGETLRRLYKGVQLRAFIGATDEVAEGEWIWANGEIFWRGGPDGESVADRYEHWADAQPANYSPVTLTAEHCLTLTFADGTWNDMRCELPLPFVCAKS